MAYTPITSADPISPLENLINPRFVQAYTDMGSISSVRQIQTYKWANAAARTAQAGMTEGDIGDQADTDARWRYSGTAWVPSGPAAVTIRVTRSTATPTVSSVSYTDMSANANWLTTTPAAQNSGFTAYNNGITVPLTGVYRIGYTLVEQANIALLGGITVNKNAGVAFADLRAPFSAAPVGSVVGLSASEQISLTSGDVLRLYALAASGTPALVASAGSFYAEWIRGN